MPPALPPDPPTNGQSHRDPLTVSIVTLLTERVTTALAHKIQKGKDEQKVVKLVTRLADGLDSSLQTFVSMIQSVAREELTDELANLREETEIHTEDAQVTAETVKTCSSIVSRIKRLRDMRRNADLTSGTKQALDREDETAAHISAELQITDKKQLRALLDSVNSQLTKYKDLMKQCE